MSNDKCPHCLAGVGFLVLALDDLVGAPASQHVKCNGCGYEWNPHAASRAPAPSDAERVLREALVILLERIAGYIAGDHSVHGPALKEWADTIHAALRAPQQPPSVSGLDPEAIPALAFEIVGETSAERIGELLRACIVDMPTQPCVDAAEIAEAVNAKMGSLDNDRFVSLRGRAEVIRDLIRSHVTDAATVRATERERCARAIRKACDNCSGEGVVEGNSEDNPHVECEYCGRPIAALKELR